MSISFNGFNEQSATFKVNGTITAGAPVKMYANETVAACAEDDIPVGVALSVRNGYACVQLGGYVTLPYSGTAPAVGYASLACNGNGGVAVDAANGKELLVLTVNSTAGTCGILL